MLSLGRRRQQRVRLKLGDVVVWVTATDIEPGKVRLGFEAPLDVLIDREELLPAADQYAATHRPRLPEVG